MHLGLNTEKAFFCTPIATAQACGSDGSCRMLFLGSQHIGPQSDSSQQDEIKPGHRTSTVVMRIAERETSLQERKTFEPWGSWKSGAVVFQGLWCEPIDLEFVKKLNIKLSEVKKDQSGIPPISIESSCHEALL